MSVPRVRARFIATLHPSNRREWVSALAASARDVPLLVFELLRLRRAHADLIAACRAALLAHRDGESDEVVWRYITDELPSAPPGHPLHNPSKPTNPVTAVPSNQDPPGPASGTGARSAGSAGTRGDDPTSAGPDAGPDAGPGVGADGWGWWR